MAEIDLPHTGWNAAKVEIVKKSFYEFLPEVIITSKETGAHTRLIEHIYRAQTAFYDGVFSALAEDKHNIFVLKARQLGLSTSIRPLFVFWAGIHDGLRGAMVYDTAFNTGQAKREVTEVIQALPHKLHFPPITENNRDSLRLENGSQILFMQAGVRNNRSGGGLGRSVGLNFAHCSEMSSWVNEEGVKSFRQSLSDIYPDRLYAWESTARGFELFYRLWKEARLDDLGSATMFFGWWSKDSQCLAKGTADFARYGLEQPTAAELRRMQAVWDQYGWEVTQEQLAWYRKKIDPNRELDDDSPEDSTLIQEQPWTEEEAFQQTGASFFQSDKLTECAAAIATMSRPQCFRFVPGIDFIGCEVYPARTRREIELRVWEEPVGDSVYVIAGDPAFGHNEKNNNSAAQVLRCFADGIDQVCEYASALIDPHQFAWLLWTLVGYYGMKPGTRTMTICELNGPGEEVWRQYNGIPLLVQQGYLRARARDKGLGDIFTNTRNYIFARSDSMNQIGHNYQWVTSNQRKIAIMESERNYLNNGVLRVRSLEVLEEMRTITRDGDTIGAEGKDRDDLTFAMALGVRAWDEKLRRGLVSGNRTREAERARLSVTMQDQWALWNKNTLDMFFKRNETVRMNAARALRSGFRATPRRAVPTRRF